jgi:hypothetical protein
MVKKLTADGSNDALNEGVRAGRIGNAFDFIDIQNAKARSRVWKRSRTIVLLPTSSVARPLGWISNPARLMNRKQRVNHLEDVNCPTFSIGGSPIGGKRLQCAHQIECDDAQHLPGTVWTLIGERAESYK